MRPINTVQLLMHSLYSTSQAYNKYGMLRDGVREHKQVELGMKLEHTKHTQPNADID